MWVWVIVGVLLVVAAGIGVVALLLTLRAVREARVALVRCADALEHMAADAKRAAVALVATCEHSAQIADHLSRIGKWLGPQALNAVSAVLPGPFHKVRAGISVARNARAGTQAMRTFVKTMKRRRATGAS